MNEEKLTPIEAALASVLRMDRAEYEKVLREICEKGMKLEPEQQEARPQWLPK